MGRTILEWILKKYFSMLEIGLIGLRLGAIHKLGHRNFIIFYPFPVLVTGGHISETPLPSVTYFAILHLEIIKLKQQKSDVTKFRIPPSPLSQNVPLRRTPPAPLTCDVIYGCSLITLPPHTAICK